MSGGEEYGTAHAAGLQQALGSLHEAAAAFNGHDPSFRARGEAVFLQLRQSPDALELVVYALEHSRDAFVHFQCLSVILVRLPNLTLQSPSKSLASLQDLRNFLLTLIHRHLNGTQEHAWWPQYTRARACQTLAAVQVRLVGLALEHAKQHIGVEQVIEEQSQFVTEHVLNLQGSHTHTSLLLAAALLAELSHLPQDQQQAQGNSKSGNKAIQSQSHTGLSPLQHRWVRAWVQERLLNVITPRVLHYISSLLGNIKSMEDFVHLAAAINLLEKLLRWRPLLADPWAGIERDVAFDDIVRLLENDRYASNDEFDDTNDDGAAQGTSTVQQAARMLPDSIVETYLNMDIISLLSATYRYIAQQDTSSMREVAVCAVKLRDCILLVSLLTSTSESSYRRGGERQALLLDTACALQSTLRQDMEGMQLLSDKGNALFFHVQLLSALLTSNLSNGGDTSRITGVLSDLTGLVLAFAYEKRAESDEEEEVASLADDVVRHLLACWTTLVVQAGSEPATAAALRAHLVPAIVKPFIDASLHAAANTSTSDGSDESEIGEENVPDQEAYSETLMFLAMLARSGELKECILHLKATADSLLGSLAGYYTTSSHATPTSKEMKILEGQWESLHWLLLITGHILADVSSGEIASVPQQVIALDAEAHGLIVQLIDCLGLGLLRMHIQASEDKAQSPQVIQSAIWFNARWLPGYLLTRSSEPLSSAFDGDEGLQRLRGLLSSVEMIMGRWLSDADIIAQVAALLRSFSKAEGVMKSLLKLPEFEQLVTCIINGLGALPASTHKPLIASLVGCIYASDQSQSPEAFFGQITQAIAKRLSSITDSPQFGQPAFSQRAETIEHLLAALDMLDGVAASTQPRSSRAVFDFLSRFFDTLIGLSQLYKDRGEVCTAVIKVLRTLTGALDLGFGISDDIVQGLNGVVWRLFANELSTTMLIGDSIESAMDEDKPFEGLCLLMDLLDDLLLASDGDENDPSSEWLAPLSNVRTVDICLFGFSRIIPLLQGAILAVPDVRSRFAHLTSQIFVLFSHRLVGLVLQESLTAAQGAAVNGGSECVRLHAMCVQALTLSLGFDESKAVADSLEAVNALASATRRVLSTVAQHTGKAHERVYGGEAALAPLLSPLLDSILRALLLEPLALSTTDWYVQTFRKLVDTVVTSNVHWTGDLDGRSKLRPHLEHFCATTSLRSSRAQQEAPHAEHQEHTPDVAVRRNHLAHAVAQLTEACLQTLSSDGDLKEYGDRARELAWTGRSQLQVR